MEKKLKKRKKITFKIIKENYIISTTILIALFTAMLFVFYQNITLKTKRNELNDCLEEYKLLKEEIDSLKEIKENYEIVVKNNEELEIKKSELENRKTELNNKINNLNSEIDKLK